MRSLTLLLAIAMSLPFASPGAASGAGIEVPIAFSNEDCRPSSSVLVDAQGGCSAALEGTLRATCTADACDVLVTAIATGVKGESEPAPTHVSVRMLYDFPWRSTGGALRGQACWAQSGASSVACGATLARTIPLEEVLVDADEEVERCASVRLDVESQSRYGVEVPVTGDVIGTRTHSATSRGVDDGDTRPWAPMWYICRADDGSVRAVESGWGHTPL